MRVILSLLSVETADTTLSQAAYDSKVEGNIIFTRLDAAINWMRKNSLWPMPMGLACCAIELMATVPGRLASIFHGLGRRSCGSPPVRPMS